MVTSIDDACAQVVAYKEGVHIKGTLLWFDALECHDVSLLSTFPTKRLPRHGSHLITSNGVARLLASRRRVPMNYSVPIVSEYFRPFSIGPHTIEFLPGGCCLGQASIWVQSRDDLSFLYAPSSMPSSYSLVHQSALKRSNVLILSASCADLSYVIPQKTQQLDALASCLREHYKEHGKYPVVVCKALGVAQEIIHHLSDFEISLYSSIYGVSQVYQECGISLPSFKRFQPSHRGAKVVLAPFTTLSRLKALAMKQSSLYFVAHNHAAYTEYKKLDVFAKHFLVNTESTQEDLYQTIQEVKPDKVVITGTYISHYMETFKGLGVPLSPAYMNNQPTLFDLSQFM